MEFFTELPRQTLTGDRLYTLITIDRLPQICASIDSVISVQSSELGEIYCVWGLFQVSRTRILNGVRFALLNCPHALAWTVAVHESTNLIVIHCTIDDQESDPEFVESIEQFVADWARGLRKEISG